MTNSVWGAFGAIVPSRYLWATETFATLRTLTPPSNTLNVTIEVDGGAAKGDGLGGQFYFDPNSVLPDDGNLVIAPATGSGRWRRILVTFALGVAVGIAINPGQILFGAVGNTLAQDAGLTWDNVAKKFTATKFGPIGVGVAITGLGLVINPGNILGISGAGTTNVTIVAQDAVSTNLALDIRDNATGTSKFSVGNTGIVTAPVSVVTPLVGTTTAADLNFQVNNQIWWFIPNNDKSFSPGQDNGVNIGKPSLRVLNVFASAIDSGTTGILDLRTNNGATQVRINNGGSANFFDIFGSAAGVALTVRANGTDTNIPIDFGTKGNSSINFRTDMLGAAPTQAQIVHTAGATQFPTATGGNGVNSKIGTNAGGLDFTSATIRFPNIGTTAVAANATLNAVGSNDLLRNSSSQRYKRDWLDLTEEDLSILDIVRTVKYKSTSEYDDPEQIHYGMLAENVFKLNKNLITLNKIDVGFDLEVPDWVQYERFIPLLIEQRRRDVRRIAALEAKVGIH